MYEWWLGVSLRGRECVRQNLGRVLVRDNGNGEKFVKYVYIGKVHRATLGHGRATKLFVTVKRFQNFPLTCHDAVKRGTIIVLGSNVPRS